MLTKVKKPARVDSGTKRGRFVIIASKYNARYVDSMLAGAQQVLQEAAVEVQVIRVPGAFEIPAVASRLASKPSAPLAALICLGIILRGETTHAQFIGEAVTTSLAQLQLQHQLPIIHEVLLLENQRQAEARCLDPKHNRGIEAATTALEMARLMQQLEADVSVPDSG